MTTEPTTTSRCVPGPAEWNRGSTRNERCLRLRAPWSSWAVECAVQVRGQRKVGCAAQWNETAVAASHDLAVEFGWGLSVIGAAAAIVLLLIVPRRRASKWSSGGSSTDSAELTVVGAGTWFTGWWPIGASWPFVRLEVFHWGIRLGPNFPWLSWLLPTTDLRWTEISGARRKWGALRCSVKSAPGQWFSFSPSRDDRLDAAFRQHGVPIRP
jgi:hypothetical protein